MINLTLDDATFIWLQISFWIVAALVVSVIAVVALYLWSEHRYPLESKKTKRASTKNKPVIILGGDDGFADVVVGEDFVHEGILESKPITKSGEPWVGFLPREGEIDELEVEKGKDKEATKKVIEWVGKMASRKLTLRGAKVPIWFAYRGKTVVMSLLGLVAIELVEEFEKSMPTVFASVDLLQVKNYFNLPWDQTQRSAQAQRKENMGFKKGLKWNRQEGLKTIAMMFIIGAIILLFAVVVLYMVKG